MMLLVSLLPDGLRSALWKAFFVFWAVVLAFLSMVFTVISVAPADRAVWSTLLGEARYPRLLSMILALACLSGVVDLLLRAFTPDSAAKLPFFWVYAMCIILALFLLPRGKK